MQPHSCLQMMMIIIPISLIIIIVIFMIIIIVVIISPTMQAPSCLVMTMVTMVIISLPRAFQWPALGLQSNSSNRTSLPDVVNQVHNRSLRVNIHEAPGNCMISCNVQYISRYPYLLNVLGSHLLCVCVSVL